MSISTVKSPSSVGERETAQLYASLDLGTNSVKLLIADLANGGAQRVFDQSIITRIGEGMHAHGGRLREIPMRRTLDAVVNFVTIAQQHHVRQIAAVGTAALRDAENQVEFLRRVRKACGLEIEVISGDEEARLSFLAVRRDPHWRHHAHLVVIDAGGGSVEIIQGEPGSDRIAARRSVNLGAVKLSERYLKSDPPTVSQLDAATHAILAEFAHVEIGAESGQATIVGVGGTVTNLTAMQQGGRSADPEALHGQTLSADTLDDLIAQLASRTIEERKQIPGLDPARADIILGGALLVSEALERLGALSLDVSTRGLRWGVLYDRFALT